MPSPFPGMDPFIERAAIWPDFHDRLITYLCGALQPLLRPRYAALTQDRLYVMESDRPIYPDVGIVHSRWSGVEGRSTAVLEPDEAAVFELSFEEVREPFIEIIEPAAGNRVVTAIEVLSPTNKAPGDGQEAYVRKRLELWSAGMNLIEIDLLRAGDKTVRPPMRRLEGLRPWHYLVAVTRRKPFREEVYPVVLDARLPRIGVPLAAGDKDAVVDLQAVFARCWDEGPYPELINYDQSPPGPLSAEETAWCTARLSDQRS